MQCLQGKRICEDDIVIMSSTRRDKSVVGMEQRILTSTEEFMMSFLLGMVLGNMEELNLETYVLDVEIYLSNQL